MTVPEKARIALAAAMVLSAGQVFAGPAEDLFDAKCGKCHFVTSAGVKYGKGKGGPDLTGFAAKRPWDFLEAYSRDPISARVKYKDIYEREIKSKNYSTKMKKIDITDAELQTILALLK